MFREVVQFTSNPRQFGCLVRSNQGHCLVLNIFLIPFNVREGRALCRRVLYKGAYDCWGGGGQAAVGLVL